MKNKMSKLLLVVVLCFSMILPACSPKDTGGIGGGSSTADIVSIAITNTQSVLTPGAYKLEAKILPTNANQGKTFSLLTTAQGVGINGDTLTIGSAAENGSKITVKVQSTYDPTKTASKEFELAITQVSGEPITNEAELRAIDTSDATRKKNYVLMNDITLTTPWEPIGVCEIEGEKDIIAQPFEGIFDGNGYTIKGIDIDSKTNMPQNGFQGNSKGFFEMIGGAGLVKNTGFEGKIRANQWSGVIAARNYGVVSNCWTNVDMEVTGVAAGALVCTNFGKVEYSYALGKTVAKGAPNTVRRSGSLFVQSGNVNACFGDKMTMETSNFDTNMSATTSDSMMTTTLMQSADTFAEFNNERWYIVNGEYPVLKNAAFVEPEAKPFIGITNLDTKIDVRADDTYQLLATISGVTNTDIDFSITTETDAATINAKTGLIAFDASKVEDFTELSVEAKSVESGITAEKTFRLINDTYTAAQGPIKISNEDELYRIASEDKFLTRSFELANDIVLDKYKAWPGIGRMAQDKQGSMPATPQVVFSGSFDGKGYTISGLDAVGVGSQWGFFSQVKTANTTDVAIKNLTLQGTIRSSGNRVGAMVGVLDKGIIENCVANVNVNTSLNIVGGFVGSNSLKTANQSTIRNCIFYGSINGNSPKGAFAGENNGTIVDCFADKETSATTQFVAGKDTLLGSLKSTVDMKDPTTYTEGTFPAEKWHKVIGNYPVLKNEINKNTPPIKQVVLGITNTETTLDLNTVTSLQITSKMIGTENTSVTYALEVAEGIAGITMNDSGLVTIVPAGELDSKSFTVKATSVENNSISYSKTFGMIYYDGHEIEISTEDELFELTKMAVVDRNYALTDNITLSKHANWPGIKKLTGSINGRGYAISGFAIKSANGFIKEISMANKTDIAVKNLKIEGSISNGEAGVVGAMVGAGWSARFMKGTIQDCIIDVDMDVKGAGCGAVIGSTGSADVVLKNCLVLSTLAPNASGWGLRTGAIYGSDDFNADITAKVVADKTIGGSVTAGAAGDITTGLFTTAEAKTVATYSAWSTDIWNIVAGEYPTLKVQVQA